MKNGIDNKETTCEPKRTLPTLFSLIPQQQFIWGFPIGFLNPANPAPILSQSRNPDGLYRPIPLMIDFCFTPFPILKRAFSVRNDFLIQQWFIEVFGHRKA